MALEESSLLQWMKIRQGTWLRTLILWHLTYCWSWMILIIFKNFLKWDGFWLSCSFFYFDQVQKLVEFWWHPGRNSWRACCLVYVAVELWDRAQICLPSWFQFCYGFELLVLTWIRLSNLWCSFQHDSQSLLSADSGWIQSHFGFLRARRNLSYQAMFVEGQRLDSKTTSWCHTQNGK